MKVMILNMTLNQNEIFLNPQSISTDLKGPQ